MANRPFFVPKSTGPVFVAEVSLEFTWVPGMAASQKRKNVVSLHKAAFQRGYDPVLEISTKSQLPLGEALSTFNLMQTCRAREKCVWKQPSRAVRFLKTAVLTASFTG